MPVIAVDHSEMRWLNGNKLTTELGAVTPITFASSNGKSERWVLANAWEVRKGAAGGGPGETEGNARLLEQRSVSTRTLDTLLPDTGGCNIQHMEASLQDWSDRPWCRLP